MGHNEITIPAEHAEPFRHFVTESLPGLCREIAGGQGGAESLERLALLARLTASIDNGVYTFTLSDDELPTFREELSDMLTAEAETVEVLPQGREPRYRKQSARRVRMGENVADQIGLLSVG